MEETKSTEKDRRRGWITSFTIHAVLLLLALLPFLSYENPPPGQQGVLVSFGAPDMGSGDDSPDTQQEEYVEPQPPAEEAAAEEEVEELVEEVAEEAVEETALEEPVEAEETPPVQELPEEVVTTDEPDEVAIQKQKEEEQRKLEEEKQKAEAREEARIAEEARKKAQSEAEAKKKAEAEAKAKADAEAKKKAEYEAAKKQFGDAFGSGKGKTDKPGNQGDPDGDPDASKLEGVSTGSGMVGGGLGDRGVAFVPDIKDNSQKTGVVVVKICVNKDGVVSEPPKFTQRGSTTTDSELVSIAIASAKKFRFSKSSIDKQCGTVTINFKVQ